ARGAPVRDSAGKIVEYIGLYEDVEDYYAAREELRRKTHELGERVKEMRCLHAVDLACNRDETPVEEILSGVALVLASAMMHPEAAGCIVEWNGETFRSPFHREPTIRITASLDVDGAAPGRVSIGYGGRRGEYAFLPEEEQLLSTAASLVAKMLARRRDRDRLESQSQELWRRQAMFEQTERLAKVGGWEYDIATSTMTWSEEVRRIAGIGADSHSAADQHASAAAFLREPLETALRSREPFDLELPWLLPSGTRKWLHAVGQVQIVDCAPARIFGIVKDITEEREARSRMWRLANHDALTGLPNRRCFGARLEALLAESGGADALLLIDLDHFKDVNDTLGHDVGDALLHAVAERLSEAAGDSDMVARLGGDEFAVLTRVPDPSSAREWAARLLADLRRPMPVAGQVSSVRFSAGLAIAPRDGSSAAEILKNADIALYSGKLRGRNALVNYAPHMRDSMERRVAVCSEVRSGLERGEFLPFYQPKVALRTGEIMGFEALLRWNHPSGMRAPGAFMPAFEDHEIALNLGKLMLSRIVSDMQIWRGSGLAYGHVALNTSAAEFTGFDLAEHVLDLLSAAGLPAESLGIEVTESVLLGRDAESISPTLRRLHAAGIRIALDDFGTGYASLTHLQQYPVDIIKIDQSFIRKISTDSGSQAITCAVLGLGRSLGMTVIAEGIETPEQAALLTAAGCDGGQG
ncbi:MAG: EAL domain-containing protein, partial [Rhizobiales bacterium]|nr:EAL domain-containing protein [Hyphomicrobiales bacterium]